MIKGVHTTFYSSEVEELRKYIKEKLGLAGTDVGGMAVELYQPIYK